MTDWKRQLTLPVDLSRGSLSLTSKRKLSRRIEATLSSSALFQTLLRFCPRCNSKWQDSFAYSSTASLQTTGRFSLSRGNISRRTFKHPLEGANCKSNWKVTASLRIAVERAPSTMSTNDICTTTHPVELAATIYRRDANELDALSCRMMAVAVALFRVCLTTTAGCRRCVVAEDGR